MRVRAFWIFVALSVFLAGLTSFRLVWLMLVKSDFYRAKAASQQLYDRETAARRGSIYDRNGKVLVASAAVWRVFASPNQFAKYEPGKDDPPLEEFREGMAEDLARILSVDADKIKKELLKDSGYVLIADKVEQERASAVREYINENGLSRYLGLEEGTKRFYSSDTLASVVLGFVGDDNSGKGGLELQYNTELTGVPGRVVAAKQPNGTDMPFSQETVVEAKPGNSLKLTIDSYIQSVCEKYLEQGIADNQVAERGVAICMDVKTGAVLAMAVKGDYNLNAPSVLSPSDQALVDALPEEERAGKLSELRNRQWRNKAVSDLYEPGSVFKVVTAAAALEENVTDYEQTYYCPGYIVVGGVPYHCAKLSGHGRQTLTQAFANSCNPAFIMLGQQLGASRFYKYFKAFGFTEKTGIDLPGEAEPIYHREEELGLTELASASFGQTFNVSPIQVITAVSAAANGGRLMRPYIVDEIVDSDGNTVKKTEPVVRRQVISEDTSAKMRELMEEVVKVGGGTNIKVPGYRVGCKTGTSQKVAKSLETGETDLYIASVCSVAPIDDPEIALLVLYDEPHGSSYYGASVAGPVVSAILSEVLPYLGHEPTYTKEDLAAMAVTVPDVLGRTVADAEALLRSKGLTCRVVGDGETVVRQTPYAERVYKGGVVLLYTEEGQEKLTATAPDFEGLSASAAKSAAAAAGINVVFIGAEDASSVAYKQSAPPGETVDAGSVITVYFRSNETED